MRRFQVVAIRKTDKEVGSQGITHIAYEESFFNPKVVITIEEVIRRITLNNKEFYIRISKTVDYLKVNSSIQGKVFVETCENRSSAYLLRLQNC